MNKKALLIFFFVLLTVITKGQVKELNWQNSRNWKIYDIHDRAGFRYSVDTLQNFRNADMGDDKVRLFLKNAAYLPNEKSGVWMGLYVATCELEDKKTRKILLSNYGGFFYDELTKQYYELPVSKRNDWMEFLNENSKKTSTIKF